MAFLTRSSRFGRMNGRKDSAAVLNVHLTPKFGATKADLHFRVVEVMTPLSRPLRGLYYHIKYLLEFCVKFHLKCMNAAETAHWIYPKSDFTIFGMKRAIAVIVKQTKHSGRKILPLQPPMRNAHIRFRPVAALQL